MKRQLEEQQVAKVKGEEERRAMELQNQLLEDRARQMLSLLYDKDLQMSDFCKKYPVPANEAERLLTIDRYALRDITAPLPEVEGILRGVCSGGELGRDMYVLYVAVHTEHTMRTVAYAIKGLEGGTSEEEDSSSSFLTLSDILAKVNGTATSKPYWRICQPKKFSACQFVLETGQLTCAVSITRDGRYYYPFPHANEQCAH